jgi:hypothetical protein
MAKKAETGDIPFVRTDIRGIFRKDQKFPMNVRTNPLRDACRPNFCFGDQENSLYNSTEIAPELHDLPPALRPTISEKNQGRNANQ